MKNIADIRKEYKKLQLDISMVNKDPIKQFDVWFEEAVKSEVTEPNAMSLATVSPSGMPDCRIVLLKGIEDEGFVLHQLPK